MLSDKFSLKSSNFLKYLALCSAIPRDWIRILKDTHETPAPVPDTVNTISINKLSCKIATQILIAKTFQPPTAERRMRQANLDDNAIQKIYNIPFNVTKDIKLAIFRYKVAHHILPTNATLFRDKIKENDKCHLCEQKQTLTHLFVFVHLSKASGQNLQIGGIQKMMILSSSTKKILSMASLTISRYNSAWTSV